VRCELPLPRDGALAAAPRPPPSGAAAPARVGGSQRQQPEAASLGSELCCRYDAEALKRHFATRPGVLLRRLVEVAAAFSAYAVKQVAAGSSSSCGGPLNSAKGSPLRDTLVSLGPAAVKIGQTLSTRPDLIGEPLSAELSLLQDDVPPFDSAAAMAIIEQELGAPPAQLFSELSAEPVASASLGQVYRGRLKDGHLEVAIKVQRPGALESVALDVALLRCGLVALRRLAGIGQDIALVADEIGEGLFGELDYRVEAANTEAFALAHARLPFVATPAVVRGCTTRRVFVSSWWHGQGPAGLLAAASSAEDGPAKQAAMRDVRELVSMGVECSLVQLLETGVLHADPHPGNLLLSRDSRLVYLDHGLLSFIQTKHSKAMFRALLHLVLEDFDHLADDLSDLGLLKVTTSREDLARDLRAELAPSAATSRADAEPGKGPDRQTSGSGSSGGTLSLRLVSAVASNGKEGGGSVGAMIDIGWGQLAAVLARLALRYRFRLPPYLTLVARSLTTLEGLALQVDPSFKVLRAALPTLGLRLLAASPGEERRLLAELTLDREGRIKPAILEVLSDAAAASANRSLIGTDSSIPVLEAPRWLSRRPISAAGAARVLLDADLPGIASQLCSARAAAIRCLLSRLLAAHLSSPSSAVAAWQDRSARRQRRLWELYCHAFLARLWQQSPPRLLQLILFGLRILCGALRLHTRRSALYWWRRALGGGGGPPSSSSPSFPAG